MEVTRLKHKVNKTVSILNKEKREKKKLADQLKKFGLLEEIVTFFL